jgi:hypothetical protein
MATETGSNRVVAYVPAGLLQQAVIGIRDIAALGCDRASDLLSGPCTVRPEPDPRHATEA